MRVIMWILFGAIPSGDLKNERAVMSAVCQRTYKVTQGIGPTESVGLCSRHPSKSSLMQGDCGTWLLPFGIRKEKEKESTSKVNRKSVAHSTNASENSQTQRTGLISTSVEETTVKRPLVSSTLPDQTCPYKPVVSQLIHKHVCLLRRYCIFARPITDSSSF